MANKLSNCGVLTPEQFNALVLVPIKNVKAVTNGNSEGVQISINGASPDGSFVIFTVDIPAGYDAAFSLEPSDSAIDVDLIANTRAPNSRIYIETSIAGVNALIGNWTIEFDIQDPNSGPIYTAGTWVFVKSLVLDEKLIKE